MSLFERKMAGGAYSQTISPGNLDLVSEMGGITTRWTGAAVACFASNLVRGRLREIAPPGQL